MQKSIYAVYPAACKRRLLLSLTVSCALLIVPLAGCGIDKICNSTDKPPACLSPCYIKTQTVPNKDSLYCSTYTSKICVCPASMGLVDMATGGSAVDLSSSTVDMR